MPLSLIGIREKYYNEDNSMRTFENKDQTWT